MAGGACMVGVYGRGHVWWGHAWQGCMCGMGCAWGVCMAGGHAWCGCMAGGMHGGGMHGRGACVAGDVHGRGCVWQGVMQAGEMATEAGGTHPTGMHSCIEILRTYNIL